MSQFECVAVVGLGLIGGSLARDLSALGTRVIGYDADKTSLEGAINAGVVHETLDKSLAGVREAEVIVIALPVDAAIAVLRRLEPHAADARLVTDVASTKCSIIGAASELSFAPAFVGSHPMAGDHRSGWTASRPGIFREAGVYLCPCSGTKPAALECAMSFWRSLGARPTVLAAEEHDRTVAWSSHVPHMMASALARLLAQHGLARHELGPGGRDLTRLAGASPGLWTSIVRDNQREIVPALAEVEQQLALLRAVLARGDEDAFNEWLGVSRSWFDAT